MESGAISDSQITASTQWNANYAPFQGRLHLKPSGVKGGSWSAAIGDDHQWLQVDLGNQYIKLTGVATQGNNEYHEWVIRYKLHYSSDGVSFRYYRESRETTYKVIWTSSFEMTLFSCVL